MLPTEPKNPKFQHNHGWEVLQAILNRSNISQDCFAILEAWLKPSATTEYNAWKAQLLGGE